MKILICADGSAHSENAIRFGGLIASTTRARTTLLGITETPGQEERIFESMKRGLESLKSRGLEPELIIKAGEPIEEIVRRTRETSYDLVVIGAVRKGTRGPFMLSTKAYKIIKAVDPAVLVVIGDRTELKNMLICSGGEKYIDTAVEFAGRIARCAGAAITVFHVMSEPPTDYASLLQMEEDVNLLLHSESELGENLRREKEVLDRMGVSSEVRLRHGLVISEVFKEIGRGDYDLVVTGSSPEGGTLRTYIMGNITREIVNRAECPVLVVRSGQSQATLGSSLRGLFSDLTSAFGGSEQKGK